MNARDFADEIRGAVVTLAAVWLVTFVLVVAASIQAGADLVLIMLAIHVVSTIVTARVGWIRLRTIYFGRRRSC